MRLVNEFIINDILDYEILNDINILEELSNLSLFIILDLIQLGNKCSEDEAENILNKALETMNYEEIASELAYELIGKKPDENEECISESDVTTFSDVLEEFYTQIQTIDSNLGLSDFKGMSTRYLYRYADGLQKRFVNKKNMELQNQYSNVAMFMNALGGKLKECPQLNEDGTLHKQTLVERVKALHNR